MPFVCSTVRPSMSRMSKDSGSFGIMDVCVKSTRRRISIFSNRGFLADREVELQFRVHDQCGKCEVCGLLVLAVRIVASEDLALVLDPAAEPRSSITAWLCQGCIDSAFAVVRAHEAS